MRGWYRMHGNSKYGAAKAKVDGHTFDSRYEAERYLYLKDRQKRGEISGLRTQVKFLIIKKVVKLVPKQLKTKVRYDEKVVEGAAMYKCDFLYVEDGRVIVEEFKSEMTEKLRDYVLRRKLMVNKIYDHNKRPNSRQWVFREVVYGKNKKTTITDK